MGERNEHVLDPLAPPSHENSTAAENALSWKTGSPQLVKHLSLDTGELREENETSPVNSAGNSARMHSVGQDNTPVDIHHDEVIGISEQVEVSAEGCCGGSCCRRRDSPGGMSCGSFIGAVANMCSAVLGAGVLSVPSALAQAGLVVGGILFAVSALATMASLVLLVRACTYYRLFTYESLVHVLLGRRWRTYTELGIVLFCQGVAVAYIVAVADLLDQAKPVLPLWLANLNRKEHMVLVWTVVLLPLSLLRSVQSLQYSSAVGIMAIAFLVLAAFDHLLNHMWHNGEAPVADDDLSNITWSALDLDVQQSRRSEDVHKLEELLWPQHGAYSILTACPMILFAFSCQCNVAQIYEELPVRTSVDSPRNGSLPPQSSLKQSWMETVMLTALCVCTLLYGGIALTALLDLGPHRVTPNILQAYDLEHNHLFQIAAAGMALAVLTAFPLNVFPARVTLQGIWEEWQKHRTIPNADLTAALLEADFGAQDYENGSALSNTREPSSGDEQDNHNNNNDDEAPSLLVPDSPGQVDDSAPSSTTANWGLQAHARHVAWTLLLAGSALLVALVAPNISIVFQIIGGTAASGLGFVIPGMIGLKLARDEQPVSVWKTRSTAIISSVLLMGGTFVAILTTAVTVYQLVEHEDVR